MDAHGLEPGETIPASRKLQREDAREILAGSRNVIVAKGRKLERFETRGEVDESILDRFLGSTGNLRAPTVRAGTKTLVGFNQDAWSDELL